MRGICQTGESSGNSAMGWTGETGEGSRSEVRGFRNFEPRTSYFRSRHSRYCFFSRMVKRIVPIRLISLTCSPT